MVFAILGLMVSVVMFDYLVFSKRFTAFHMVILPYLLITLINNTLGVWMGFYRITDNTMFMVLVGGLFFFAGNCLVHLAFRDSAPVSRADISGIDRDILSVDRIRWYVILVLSLRFLQLLLIFARNGIDRVIANDFELLLTKGAMGHLMISVFPLIPILFYHWLIERKKIIDLFLTGLYFIMVFIETEKAQVLTITIAVFLYCVLKNRKYLKKGLLIMGSMIALLFMGNYAMKFIMQGVYDSVGKDYYFYRFWSYIAGSLINSRVITDSALRIPSNGFSYLADVFLSVPNLFAAKLLGHEIGPDVRAAMPYMKGFLRVTKYTYGYKKQTGNVITTMTYIFGNGNWIIFALVVTFWGILAEFVMYRMYSSGRDISITTCCCFMAFSMVSFFGSYYTSASFTERLIYCGLWAVVFNKNIRLRLTEETGWETYRRKSLMDKQPMKHGGI